MYQYTLKIGHATRLFWAENYPMSHCHFEPRKCKLQLKYHVRTWVLGLKRGWKIVSPSLLMRKAYADPQVSPVKIFSISSNVTSTPITPIVLKKIEKLSLKKNEKESINNCEVHIKSSSSGYCYKKGLQFSLRWRCYRIFSQPEV